MSGSLLRRNIGLLVGVVLAGQILAGLLVLGFVLKPQTVRFADVSARMLKAVSIAMEGEDAAGQMRIAQEINADGNIRLRPEDDPPDAGGRAFPGLLERTFMRSLAERMAPPEGIYWRTDRLGRLWMQVPLGGKPWWVNVTSPRLMRPLLSLFIASLVAFVVAAAGGLLLQRRLDRPLRALARGAADFEPGSAPRPIDVEGPREIAAVAHAFNDMAKRIAAHEDERELMLAGVSHDLRTPLARLRLSIELMKHEDEDLRESAHRQVELIDRMLGQFLDYARRGGHEAREEVDLATLLGAAAEDAGLAGSIAIEAERDLHAVLRPMAMRRAIRNLLENAARYGAAPIALTAGKRPDGAIAIEVADHGKGFDPALADHFLKPFVKADSARGGQGTGLGLAIAQRQVAEEGGWLCFERRNGRFVAAIVLPVS